MAEYAPFSHNEETSDDSNVDTEVVSKKKKKSSKKLGASIFGKRQDQTEKPTDIKEKTGKLAEGSVDKMLADLLLEKSYTQPTAEEIEAFENPDLRIRQKDLRRPGYVDMYDNAPDIPPSQEVVEYAISRDLTSDELSRGEVIVRLHDNETSAAEFASPVERMSLAEQEPIVATVEPTIAEDSVDITDKTPVSTSATAKSGTRVKTGRSGNGGSSKNVGGVIGGATGGGSRGGGGSVPPTPPGSSSPFPYNSRRPKNVPQTPNVPSTNIFNITPVATMGFDQILRAQLMAEAARNRLKGRGEGMIVGLLLGGGIEHFRNKNRERRLEKKMVAENKRQEKRIDDIDARQLRQRQEQIEAARQAERDRYAHRDTVKAETAATAKAQIAEATASARAKNAEKLNELQEKEKAELVERLNAHARAQEELAAKIVPDEHRVETSAWHAYEVDKQGNTVQDTTIEYGHEYYQERAAETGPKDQQIGVKAGSTALAGATLRNDTPSLGMSGGAMPVMTQQRQTNEDLGLPPMFGVKSNDSQSKSSQILPILPPASPADDVKTPTTGLLPWIIVIVILIALIALLS